MDSAMVACVMRLALSPYLASGFFHEALEPPFGQIILAARMALGRALAFFGRWVSLDRAHGGQKVRSSPGVEPGDSPVFWRRMTVLMGGAAECTWGGSSLRSSGSNPGIAPCLEQACSNSWGRRFGNSYGSVKLIRKD